MNRRKQDMGLRFNNLIEQRDIASLRSWMRGWRHLLGDNPRAVRLIEQIERGLAPISPVHYLTDEESLNVQELHSQVVDIWLAQEEA